MIVGVGSWRGTGASTTALLMALGLTRAGERPWLIEVDPAGGSLAARLEPDQEPLVPGTLELVAFPTQRGPVVDRFAASAIWWQGVRIVTAPGDPFRAWACHQPRVGWAPALRELDGPVVVDLGRLRGGSPVEPVLHQLDVVLLASSSDAADLVATTDWANLRGRVTPMDDGLAVDLTRIVVIDAPSSAGVSRSAAEYELGDRFAGWLPWTPGAVDLARRGASGDRRMRRQPVMHAVDEMLDRLRRWSPHAPADALVAPTAATATAALGAAVAAWPVPNGARS